jgi:hypothetical protein
MFLFLFHEIADISYNLYPFLPATFLILVPKSSKVSTISNFSLCIDHVWYSKLKAELYEIK